MSRTKTRQPRALYRIEHRNGRWMIVAPDGSPFVSIGVVHTGAMRAFRENSGADRESAAEQVVANLREWGFNTVGYHHPEEIRSRMPFFVDTYLAWIPFFDPQPRYHDVFAAARAARTPIQQMCAHVKSNPNLVGYFWTDTPRWDLDTARRLVNDDWVSAIRRNNGLYAGKKRYIEFLRERHGASPEKFRKIYGMDLNDPSILDADFAGLPLDDDVVHRDDYDFLRLIARQYYRAAGEAMEREDRKHLVFGDRYLYNDLPIEVLEEALPWIDAVAIQPWELKFDKAVFERVYRIARKPILICDHAIGFPTEKYPKVGWQQCATEADAARAYESYLRDALALPYVLGYHRCHYMDHFSKSAGFLMQGLVREDSSPYQTLVEGMSRANHSIIAEFPNLSAGD